jgi:hypothetical protein
MRVLSLSYVAAGTSLNINAFIYMINSTIKRMGTMSFFTDPLLLLLFGLFILPAKGWSGIGTPR